MARCLARFAVRALYFEVKSHPKPGLVSFVCPGGHQDMHGELFYRSLFSLRHYFYTLVRQDAVSRDFQGLKALGIQAEEQMLRATGGVNTHRGALFALGLVSVSVARLAMKNPRFTPLDLHLQLVHDWDKTLASHQGAPDSHGALVAKKHAVIGAKEMARQGYPIIFCILDDFLQMCAAQHALEHCCLYAYARLLEQIDDTNILYRHDAPGLMEAKYYAKQLLSIDHLEARHQYALEVHDLFSKHHISPGGVGDLIAVLFFVGQLFQR